MTGAAVDRVPAGAVPPFGRFRAGAATVDITPHPGLPLAGYSVGGPRALGARGRLRARVAAFDDGFGNRIGFVVADLHSGARYLNELVAAEVARDTGLSIDRLVVFGTHTHTAHGGFYGDSFYDRMTAHRGDFDPELARWTAGRIAAAVRAACADLHPAALHKIEIPVLGVVRNRALKSHRATPEGKDATDPYAAIDERLTVLAAAPEDPTRSLVAFAVYGAHATALGPGENRFEPDWPGRAALRAERALATGAGAWSGATVALANGAAGDVTPMGFRHLTQSPALADAVGAAIGDRLILALRNVAGAPAETAPRIEARFEESPFDGPDGFAQRWAAGHPIIGGAEDGRSSHFSERMREGWPTPAASSPYRSDPAQVPKTPLLESKWLAEAAVDFLLLHPPRVLTLRAFAIGATTLVALPFEPTVVAVRRLEEALAKAGHRRVRTVGYAGAFNGYLTAPEEYDVQLYEGAHTLWGRDSLPAVTARLARLLAGPAPAVPPTAEFPDVYRDAGRAFLFNGPGPRERASWEGWSLAPNKPGPEDDEIVATFVVTQSHQPLFAGGPWASVETKDPSTGTWSAATVDGVGCDDASGFAAIGGMERLPADAGGIDRFRFRYEFRAPAEPLRALARSRPIAKFRLRLDFVAGDRRTLEFDP